MPCLAARKRYVRAWQADSDATNSCSGFTREASPRKPGADDIGTGSGPIVTSRSRLNVAGSRVPPCAAPDHSRWDVKTSAMNASLPARRPVYGNDGDGGSGTARASQLTDRQGG